MKYDKFISRFNFVMNLLVLASVLIGGFVWADSNGIWHRAEDVKAGTFGGDEGGGDYTFPNNMSVNGSICLDGECHPDWGSVCQSWLEDNAAN